MSIPNCPRCGAREYFAGELCPDCGYKHVTVEEKLCLRDSISGKKRRGAPGETKPYATFKDAEELHQDSGEWRGVQRAEVAGFCWTAQTRS